MVALPYLLPENAEDLFDFEGASQPRIQCDKPSADIPSADINVISEENTSYHVMVERFRLISTKDFIKTFGELMAAFYVFDIRIYKESGRVVHNHPKTLFKHQ